MHLGKVTKCRKDSEKQKKNAPCSTWQPRGWLPTCLASQPGSSLFVPTMLINLLSLHLSPGGHPVSPGVGVRGGPTLPYPHCMTCSCPLSGLRTQGCHFSLYLWLTLAQLPTPALRMTRLSRRGGRRCHLLQEATPASTPLAASLMVTV